MGVDIHMMLVRNGKVVVDNVFEGRNREWFDNITERGYGDEYETFPCRYGWADELEEVYNEYKEWAYDFRTLSVVDFNEWFEKNRPDIDAGWVTKREAWLYVNKGIVPEYLAHTKSSCVANNTCTIADESEYMCPDDAEFITVVDEYDCSAWLYRWCVKNAEAGDQLIYCFDC